MRFTITVVVGTVPVWTRHHVPMEQLVSVMRELSRDYRSGTVAAVVER